MEEKWFFMDVGASTFGAHLRPDQKSNYDMSLAST